MSTEKQHNPIPEIGSRWIQNRRGSDRRDVEIDITDVVHNAARSGGGTGTRIFYKDVHPERHAGTWYETEFKYTSNFRPAPAPEAVAEPTTEPVAAVEQAPEPVAAHDPLQAAILDELRAIRGLLEAQARAGEGRGHHTHHAQIPLPLNGAARSQA